MEKLLNYFFNIKNIVIPNHLTYYGDMNRTLITSHRRLPNNQRDIIHAIFEFIKNDTIHNGNIRMFDLFDELCKTFKPIPVLKVLAETNLIPSYELTKQILLFNDYEIIQYFVLFNRLCYLNMELLEMRLNKLLDEPTKLNLDIFKVCCNSYRDFKNVSYNKINTIGNILTINDINDFKQSNNQNIVYLI
jgi:hypothetical protein